MLKIPLLIMRDQDGILLEWLPQKKSHYPCFLTSQMLLKKENVSHLSATVLKL